MLHKLRRGGHREQRRIVMFDWSILITIASIIGTIANIYKSGGVLLYGCLLTVFGAYTT